MYLMYLQSSNTLWQAWIIEYGVNYVYEVFFTKMLISVFPDFVYIYICLHGCDCLYCTKLRSANANTGRKFM